MKKQQKWMANPIGLLIPFKGTQDKNKIDMLLNTKVFITSDVLKNITSFKDITEESIINKIKEFNPLSLLEVLSKLNFLFYEFEDINRDIENLFIKDLFPIELSEEIIEHINNRNELFFTRPQILMVIKLCILNSDDKGGNKIVVDNLRNLGCIFLKINDLLESDLKSLSDSENVKKEKIISTVIQSYEFFDSQQFRYTIARYSLLFNVYSKKIKNRNFCILNDYKKLTGIDIQLFMTILISIYSFYKNKKQNIINFIKKPKNFFLTKDYYKNCSEAVKRKIFTIFKIISNNINGFKEIMSEERFNLKSSKYEFIHFKRKPFLELDNGTFLPIDLIFLENKLTTGIYWEIFDNLEIQKRNNFASYWGKIFELYVTDLLKRCWGSSGRLFLADDVTKEKKGQRVDAIIYYPEALIFLEITVKKIDHTSLISGNYNFILKKLTDIMAGGELNKKGKLIQLFEDIERFQKGDLILKGIKNSSIKNFYPILIFEHGFPIVPVFDFRKELKQRDEKLSNYNLLLNKLQILDIEELEILEPLIKKGNSFKDYLDLKISKYRDISFKNFIYSIGVKELGNEFLLEEFKKFWKKSEKILKPRKNKKLE